VVDDEVGDDADPAVARRAHELDHVPERPEPRVHRVEVGDVVAVVPLGDGKNGMSHRHVTPIPAR
jgi:hypothetical protein